MWIQEIVFRVVAGKVKHLFSPHFPIHILPKRSHNETLNQIFVSHQTGQPFAYYISQGGFTASVIVKFNIHNNMLHVNHLRKVNEKHCAASDSRTLNRIQSGCCFNPELSSIMHCIIFRKGDSAGQFLARM